MLSCEAIPQTHRLLAMFIDKQDAKDFRDAIGLINDTEVEKTIRKLLKNMGYCP